MGSSHCLLLLLACLCLMPSLSPAAQGPAPAPLDCSTALVPLLPCLDFVQGNVSTPPKNCCDALASVVASTPICLCSLFSNSLGITVNITNALMLPSLCKVTTPPLSQCAANGFPVPGPLASPPTTKAPTSSTSPASSPKAAVPSAATKPPSSSPPASTPTSTSPSSTPAASMSPSSTPAASMSPVPSTAPSTTTPTSGPAAVVSKAPASSASTTLSPPAPSPSGSAGFTVCGAMWLVTMIASLQIIRG